MRNVTPDLYSSWGMLGPLVGPQFDPTVKRSKTALRLKKTPSDMDVRESHGDQRMVLSVLALAPSGRRRRRR